MFQDIVEDEHFKTRQCFEEVELAGRKVKVPSIGSVSSDLGVSLLLSQRISPKTRRKPGIGFDF